MFISLFPACFRIVNEVPEGTLKHYLIILAPILTVVISGLWLVAQKTIDWEVSKRFLDRAKKAIQERIQKAENDPSCSPEYLKELKDMLLKVEKAELEKLYKFATLE